MNLSQDELLARCAWCLRLMREDEQCFRLGVRVYPEVKPFIAQHEGSLVPLPLGSGREVIAAVPAADSDARAAGNDIIFKLCSEECAHQLSEAIKGEISGESP